ncbi:hypothetical protein FGO68_gene12079 [Halteria grandinella]|uniref:Uncharacterized protein n=1 Tax=Halteria grandinella TaxID=5974 RepID=A0A8J8P746_HALGN|nr:hypothetical protein FGO68_gene12079 [Halteria grandinella]
MPPQIYPSTPQNHVDLEGTLTKQVQYRDTEQIELLKQILLAVSAKPRSDIAQHTAIQTINAQPQQVEEKVLIKKYGKGDYSENANRHDMTTQTINIERDQHKHDPPKNQKMSNSIFSTTMPVTLSMTIDDASPIKPPLNNEVTPANMETLIEPETHRYDQEEEDFLNQISLRSQNNSYMEEHQDNYENSEQQIQTEPQMKREEYGQMKSSIELKVSDEGKQIQASNDPMISRDSLGPMRNAILPQLAGEYQLDHQEKEISAQLASKSNERKSVVVKVIGFQDIMAEPPQSSFVGSGVAGGFADFIGSQQRKSSNVRDKFSENTLKQIYDLNFRQQEKYNGTSDSTQKGLAMNRISKGHIHSKSDAISQFKLIKQFQSTESSKKDAQRNSQIGKKAKQSEDDVDVLKISFKSINPSPKESKNQLLSSLKKSTQEEILRDTLSPFQNNEYSPNVQQEKAIKGSVQSSGQQVITNILIAGQGDKIANSPLTRIGKEQNQNLSRAEQFNDASPLNSSLKVMNPLNKSQLLSGTIGKDDSISLDPLGLTMGSFIHPPGSTKNVIPLALHSSRNGNATSKEERKSINRQPTSATETANPFIYGSTMKSTNRRSTVLILKNDTADLQNHLVQMYALMQAHGTGPQRQGTLGGGNSGITRQGTGVSNVPTQRVRNTQSKMLMVQNLVSKIKKRELPHLPTKIEQEAVVEESLDEESSVSDQEEDEEHKDPSQTQDGREAEQQHLSKMEQAPELLEKLEPFAKLAKEQPTAPKGKRRFIDYMMASAKSEFQNNISKMSNNSNKKVKRKRKITISSSIPRLSLKKF